MAAEGAASATVTAAAAALPIPDLDPSLPTPTLGSLGNLQFSDFFWTNVPGPELAEIDGFEDYESWQASQYAKSQAQQAAAAAAAALAALPSSAPVTTVPAPLPGRLPTHPTNIDTTNTTAVVAAVTPMDEAFDSEQEQSVTSSAAVSAAKRGKRGAAASSASGGDLKQKKQQNKAAADRYRRKKRAQFELLQSQSTVVVEENTQLKKKCERLESEVTYLKELLLATVRQSITLPSVAAALQDTTAAKSKYPVKQTNTGAIDGEQALQAAITHLATEHHQATEARLAALEQKLDAVASKG
jgi:hypothetical protein